MQWGNKDIKLSVYAVMEINLYWAAEILKRSAVVIGLNSIVEFHWIPQLHHLMPSIFSDIDYWLGPRFCIVEPETIQNHILPRLCYTWERKWLLWQYFLSHLPSVFCLVKLLCLCSTHFEPMQFRCWTGSWPSEALFFVLLLTHLCDLWWVHKPNFISVY